MQKFVIELPKGRGLPTSIETTMTSTGHNASQMGHDGEVTALSSSHYTTDLDRDVGPTDVFPSGKRARLRRARA